MEEEEEVVFLPLLPAPLPPFPPLPASAFPAFPAFSPPTPFFLEGDGPSKDAVDDEEDAADPDAEEDK